MVMKLVTSGAEGLLGVGVGVRSDTATCSSPTTKIA